MPDQIEQTEQTPVIRDRRTDRDLQRQALRELVALASHSARRATEIDQKHKAEHAAAEDKLDKSLFTTEQRAEHLKSQVRQKHAEHSEQIARDFKEEIAQHQENDLAMRRQIDQVFEQSDTELKQKLQQSTWLADSVLEATLNQLRDESNRHKREQAAHNELLDGLENRAGALMFSYGVNVATLPESPPLPAAPADADAEIKQQYEHAEELLTKLEALSAPRLLTGVTPYFVSLVIIFGAAAAAQLINAGVPTWTELKTFDLRWREIGINSGIALAGLVLLGIIVRFVGKSQAKRVYLPMRQAIAASRQAGKVKMERAHEDREARRQRAARKREMEVGAAKDKFTPLAAKVAAIREKSLLTHLNDHKRRTTRAEQQRDAGTAETDAWQTKHLDDIQKRADHDILPRAINMPGRSPAASRNIGKRAKNWSIAGRPAWRKSSSRSKASGKNGNGQHRDWNDSEWKSWTPPTKFSPTVQFGELEVDLKELTETLKDSRLELGPKHFRCPRCWRFRGRRRCSFNTIATAGLKRCARSRW